MFAEHYGGSKKMTFEIRDAPRSPVFEEFMATYFTPEYVPMARCHKEKYDDRPQIVQDVEKARTKCRSVARDEQQLVRLSNKYGIQVSEDTYSTLRDARSESAQQLLLLVFDNQNEAMNCAEDVVRALGR